MPRHVDELRDNDPFPVKPGTNEYAALSFLVSHRDYGFRPTEISDHTDLSKASASKTMARLFEKGLVERSEGVYYVAPERATNLERRLNSIDAAERLFEATPEDDAYAQEGWEDDLPSLDPERDSERPETNDIDETADTLIDSLTTTETEE